MVVTQWERRLRNECVVSHLGHRYATAMYITTLFAAIFYIRMSLGNCPGLAALHRFFIGDPDSSGT